MPVVPDLGVEHLSNSYNLERAILQSSIRGTLRRALGGER